MNELRINKKQIQVNVPGDLKSVYVNSIKINVTDEEVILQCLLVRPGGDRGTLVSELVLSPKHAIRFQRALDETLKKHFTRHLPE